MTTEQIRIQNQPQRNCTMGTIRKTEQLLFLISYSNLPLYIFVSQFLKCESGRAPDFTSALALGTRVRGRRLASTHGEQEKFIAFFQCQRDEFLTPAANQSPQNVPGRYIPLASHLFKFFGTILSMCLRDVISKSYFPKNENCVP